MPGPLTPEQLRALDAVRIGPADLRRLVACLNPDSPRPDCRDAAQEKLREVVAGATGSPAPSACYSLHLQLLKIALDLEISYGLAGSIDSTVSFLEAMKKPLAGHPALDLANAFLGRTRGRRLEMGELREALWLYDLNSLSAADREGTVLDLGSPAALKVEADFMHAFVDPARVRAGDLRELLRDADPVIRKRARQWVDRRKEGALPAPPGPASPSENLACWLEGRRLLRAEGEGLTLEVSPREPSMLRYQIAGLRDKPVFLPPGEFTDTVMSILRTFGRVCVFREPSLDPEAALSSEPGAFLPAGKPAPHFFSWDRGRDALAATWRSLDLAWLLRPGADDATILIVQGSLRDVLRRYFEPAGRGQPPS